MLLRWLGFVCSCGYLVERRSKLVVGLRSRKICGIALARFDSLLHVYGLPSLLVEILLSELMNGPLTGLFCLVSKVELSLPCRNVGKCDFFWVVTVCPPTMHENMR